jgi:hypothetical protein
VATGTPSATPEILGVLINHNTQAERDELHGSRRDVLAAGALGEIAGRKEEERACLWDRWERPLFFVKFA